MNQTHVKIARQGVDAWNAWRLANPTVVPNFENAQLDGLDLYYGAKLEGANFRNATLSEASLVRAFLEGADFRGAKLNHANLRRANCEGTCFVDADLSDTDLRFAFMNRTDLRNANLARSNFEVLRCDGAYLAGANIVGIRIPEDSIPAGPGSSSIYNLAFADGLCDVNEASQLELKDYMERVFSSVHRIDDFNLEGLYIHGSPAYDESTIEEILSQVNALRKLYRGGVDEDAVLITAVSQINTKLIEFLKQHPQELNSIHWRVFEELIAEILASYGWNVELTNPTKDGGYDIFGLYTDRAGIRHSCIVECKRWSNQVGVDVVRGLYTVKNDLRVGSALLATTSDFTRGAKEFKASRYDLELRNYEEILEWINAYQPHPDGRLFLKNGRVN